MELERQQIEMEKTFLELQAESETAELKKKKAFENHQLRFQIEEV